MDQTFETAHVSTEQFHSQNCKVATWDEFYAVEFVDIDTILQYRHVLVQLFRISWTIIQELSGKSCIHFGKHFLRMSNLYTMETVYHVHKFPCAF